MCIHYIYSLANVGLTIAILTLARHIFSYLKPQIAVTRVNILISKINVPHLISIQTYLSFRAVGIAALHLVSRAKASQQMRLSFTSCLFRHPDLTYFSKKLWFSAQWGSSTAEPGVCKLYDVRLWNSRSDHYIKLLSDEWHLPFLGSRKSWKSV